MAIARMPEDLYKTNQNPSKTFKAICRCRCTPRRGPAPGSRVGSTGDIFPVRCCAMSTKMKRCEST
eukprot:15329155-Heterocapsa_arctica.AAC.1